MCLDTVDRKPKQVTEGWKIFRVIDDKLYGLFQNIEFETNKWIKDSTNYFIISDEKKKYQTGFHFYLDKEEAEDRVILLKKISMFNIKIHKVKVKNITVTGLQDNYRVGITREIFIEEE